MKVLQLFKFLLVIGFLTTFCFECFSQKIHLPTMTWTKRYHSVQGLTITGFDDGSSVYGGGILYSLRSYNFLSFIPGVGLYDLFYDDIDANKDNITVLEGHAALNLEIDTFAHIRLTAYAGINQVPLTGFERNQEFVRGLTFGVGFTVWRFEIDGELGSEMLFNESFYSIGRLTISYIFNDRKNILSMSPQKGN